MPSRQPLPPPRPLVSLTAIEPPPPPEPPNNEPPQPHHHHHRHHHHISNLIPPIAGGAAALSILLFLALIYRKLSRKRTVPTDLKPPHRFSYSVLRRATSSFSSSNRLGQGGFGSVYRGILPSGQEIAVKLMDSGSLQGEREFQNELSVAGKIECDRVVSLLGFSCDRKRRRLLLVYELMNNRSVQDALLDRKCPELMEWKKRFAVAIDIAKGLEFLHTVCDPPVIHGDIKPSNILLDCYFSAKISDFGLARLKIENNADVVAVEEEVVVVVAVDENDSRKGKKVEDSEINDGGGEENGSILEETESVITAYEDANAGVESVEQSPGSLGVADALVSPETTFVVEASPSEILDKTSISEGNFDDKVSIDSGKDVISRRKSISGKDWWWRQDNGNGGGGGAASDSGSVKDYVMEWIGNEIKERRRTKSDWITSSASADEANTGTGTGTVTMKPSGKSERKKQRRLEWWTSLDEEKIPNKDKNRPPPPPREWWREEFCEELAKKKNKKKRDLKSRSGGSSAGEQQRWWQRDEDLVPEKRKKKTKKNRSRRSSRSSVDWWLDGLSGDLRNGGWSGENHKSGVSSTPSMRGTVCYVAPEYCIGGQVTDKCDVYSYGVLLLVLISGRRPLQVTASPMSEFERANLISWAKHLARAGKLLELVDPSIQSLDRVQVLLCITVALLCLQRSPVHRPSMKKVVAMLSGECEPPNLPLEFSPSPPSTFPFKSRKKARRVA